MHFTRANIGVAVVNGQIYAIGGDNGTEIGNVSPGTSMTMNVVNVNEAYNPSSDTWVSAAPMPTARALFGTAVYQNKIYCIGGYSGKVVFIGPKAGIGKPNITTSQPTKSMILPQIHGRPRLRFKRRGIQLLLTLLMERYTSSEDIQRQTSAKEIISTKFTIRRPILGQPRVRRQCQLSVLLQQSLTITSTF